MQYVNNRRNCVENIWEFSVPFTKFFCTYKSVLKISLFFFKKKLITAQTKRAFVAVGQIIFF